MGVVMIIHLTDISERRTSFFKLLPLVCGAETSGVKKK